MKRSGYRSNKSVYIYIYILRALFLHSRFLWRLDRDRGIRFVNSKRERTMKSSNLNGYSPSVRTSRFFLIPFQALARRTYPDYRGMSGSSRFSDSFPPVSLPVFFVEMNSLSVFHETRNCWISSFQSAPFLSRQREREREIVLIKSRKLIIGADFIQRKI